MTGTRLPALEEGAGPREIPHPELRPKDPSPLQAVARWVEAMWPWCRFAGLTSRGWPYLGGRFLKEGHPTPWGVVWTDGPKTLWAWEPRGQE